MLADAPDASLGSNGLGASCHWADAIAGPLGDQRSWSFSGSLMVFANFHAGKSGLVPGD